MGKHLNEKRDNEKHHKKWYMLVDNGKYVKKIDRIGALEYSRRKKDCNDGLIYGKAKYINVMDFLKCETTDRREDALRINEEEYTGLFMYSWDCCSTVIIMEDN